MQKSPVFMRSVFVFFLVSGFCSILYELVWLRLSMAQFGVTTALVSIVLSTFMAGLGLGSWISGRLIRRYGGAMRTPALRFYAGSSTDPCSGSLYLDDGTSYAYRQGAYLRMKFSCEVAADGFHLHIAPREGTYPAWWKEIRAEIYGWTPKQNSALVKGTTTPLQASQLQHGVAVTIPENDQGLDLDLK